MKKILALLLVAISVISLAACSSDKPSDGVQQGGNENSEVQNIALEGVYNDCAALMPEMLALDEGMLLDYCGVSAADCAQFYVSICSNSLRTDEIWLIEATDSDALKRISDLAQVRLQAKGEESITYSPEQYAIVQKAKTVTVGNYFALLVSPDVDALEATVNAAFGK